MNSKERIKMSIEKEIDFEVLREPWNKYSLTDGSYIKSRYILTKVKKVEPFGEIKGKVGVEGRTVTVPYNVPLTLKGVPNMKKYSSNELKEAIDEEIRYSTISEEWNEYIVDDGTRIRIKDTVTNITRIKLKDRNGDPIYIVSHSTLVQVKPTR